MIAFPYARVPATLALGALALSGLAACGGSVAAGTASPPTPTTPAVTKTPEPLQSLLSGRAAKDGPVLAVKIDNSTSALPHVGLTTADVVYVQQVEGGISRLAAIYSTKLPKLVVPVRSARETDAQLFPQYGTIPIGFSGSVSEVHRLLRGAGLIDVSQDVGGAGYSRVSGRRAPHNLAASPATLLARAGKPADAKDVGFRFNSTAPPGGRPTASATAQMPAARIGFTYDSKSGRWAVSLDGRADRTRAEGQVAASTVIVQSVAVNDLGRRDSAGAAIPMTTTVGRGKATVLRDGRAYQVTWSRPAANRGTRWTYKGKDFPMKAGQVWVVLLDADRSVKLTRP